MADAANTIDGKLVVLSISTNIAVPAYLSVVCKVDGGLSASTNVNSVETGCGTAKARGAANYTVTGSFAANTDPEVTEMSADALLALMESGDDFLWKMAHITTPADYFRSGTGFFSAYSETANVGDVVKGDFTIDVKGSIDVTP